MLSLVNELSDMHEWDRLIVHPDFVFELEEP